MSIGNFFKSVEHGAENVVHSVEHAAEGAAKAVEHAAEGAAKTVGHAATGAVKAVEHAAASGAKAVEHAAASGAKAIEQGAKAVAHAVSGPAEKLAKFASDGWEKLEYQIGIDKGVDAEKTVKEEAANQVAKGEADKAKADLTANGKAEAAALAKLPPAERDAYATVKAGMAGEKGDPAGEDAVAERALQKMLIAGKVGGKDLRGGKTVLDNLATIAKEPLAPGIDRGALLCETTREIADATTINQEGKGTCGAAVSCMMLAMKNPSEYTRIVGQLATPAGKAVLQNGDTITRVPDWQAPDRGRTTSQRLLEPALMNYGYSADGTTYSNTKDDRSLFGIGTPGGASTGLADWEQEKVLTGLYGEKYSDHLTLAGSYDGDWKSIQSWTGRGEPIPASICYGGGIKEDHHVIITGVAGDNVTIMNPQGKVETFSKEQFQKMMLSYRTPG
jgi:hypothetical protein